jgi:hypothetical protein
MFRIYAKTSAKTDEEIIDAGWELLQVRRGGGEQKAVDMPDWQ